MAFTDPCPRCAAPGFVLTRRSRRRAERAAIAPVACRGAARPGGPPPSRLHRVPFGVDVVPDRGHVRVRLIGELDVATAPEVERHLAELRDAGWTSLVLDLGGLTFLCSSGLHLVLRWVAAAREDGFAFAVLAGPPEVQRVFDMSGLTELVPFAGEELVPLVKEPSWR